MKTLLVNQFETQFKPLFKQARGLCISIYMPNYSSRKGQRQQNLIRFQKLLRQAQELLGANRRSPIVALKILQPAFTLMYDKAFWQHQDKGLALFLAQGVFYYYHLPVVVEELVVMDERFYFEPLVGLMH